MYLALLFLIIWVVVMFLIAARMRAVYACSSAACDN